jgi:hypothetical protein
MDLITKEEAKKMISEAGLDVDSGIEYLYGTEHYIDEYCMYPRKMVIQFINR